jgi:uncharacterized protein YjbJ (UPF0337 family)
MHDGLNLFLSPKPGGWMGGTRGACPERRRTGRVHNGSLHRQSGIVIPSAAEGSRLLARRRGRSPGASRDDSSALVGMTEVSPPLPARAFGPASVSPGKPRERIGKAVGENRQAVGENRQAVGENRQAVGKNRQSRGRESASVGENRQSRGREFSGPGQNSPLPLGRGPRRRQPCGG